jgi:hypothetical protein
MPLGYALTGPLIGVIGVRGTLVGMAACATVLSAELLLVRDLRDIGRRDYDT